MPTRRSSFSSSSSAYSSSPSKSPPGKNGAKKVGLQRKLHSIVLCEHEKNEAQLLMSFRGKKLIRYTRPIGQRAKPTDSTESTTKKKNSCAKRQPELQTFGCSVLRAIENFVRLLHHKKYTLQGNLTVSMLYWISSSRSVKLRKESIPNLEEYNDEGAKLDYSSIGVSIRDDLFGRKGLNPPADVLAWIDLMLADPLKDKYLVRYNVALFHRRAKMDLFLALYEKLLQLKELVKVDKANRPRYEKVINNITVGKSDLYVWLTDVTDNIYVQKVYDKKREGRYDTVFELLRFVRDCIHHLMDYSVEDNALMFSVDDKYLMIETCFPGVFHKFQKAMVDAGLEDGEHVL